MPLWGTDETKGEKKPTWQRDKDATGSKGRPAINEERITFATQADRSADPKRKHSGWVRKVTKTLPDGTVRVIEELLVATSNASLQVLPDRMGDANVTSITFRVNSIAANSGGFVDETANVMVDVSFNEAVDVPGSVQLQLSNGTVNFNVNAFPNQWDGVSSTWGLGSQNNTNLITFTVNIDDQTTGNGPLQITGTGLVAEAAITDNIGGATAVVTGLNAKTEPNYLAGEGATRPVISAANTIILGRFAGV